MWGKFKYLDIDKSIEILILNIEILEKLILKY